MPWSTDSRHSRGYGYKWTKLRERILKRDRHLCQACLATGRVTNATEVHHIKAKAKGGTDDEDNLISICHPCHEAATMADQGARSKQTIGPDGWPVS